MPQPETHELSGLFLGGGRPAVEKTEKAEAVTSLVVCGLALQVAQVVILFSDSQLIVHSLIIRQSFLKLVLDPIQQGLAN